MTNLEIVQRMYASFGMRDRDTILELFDPQIEWVQNEGFPGGGRHVGAEAVLTDVFAKFRLEWDVWEAVVTEWLDAGETIIAIGEYRGTVQSDRTFDEGRFRWGVSSPGRSYRQLPPVH